MIGTLPFTSLGSKIFKCFWKNLFDHKYNKKCNIVKYYYKLTVSHFNIFV